MPQFNHDELVCADAPAGQLPKGATVVTVAGRVIDIDAAGEDCRQHLAKVRMKLGVYQEVTQELNAGHKPKIR